MNLIPILSEQEYQNLRADSWPEYAEVQSGIKAVSKEEQHKISAAFDQGYQRYLEQHRGDEIAEGNRNIQRQTFFDKKVNPKVPHCRRPWQTLGVNSYGDVFICISPAWIPKFAGNIMASEDIYNILNSSKARAIRNEIIGNRYYFCNFDLCGFTRDLQVDDFSKNPQQSGDFQPLTHIDRPDAVTVTEIPHDIIFDFDHTCNYKCPSCRTEMINYNKHPVIAPLNQRIADRVKTMIIDQIGSQPVEIRWAGGEPFISRVYLDLMEYIIHRHPAGNVRHCIQTNGSYLKSRDHLVRDLLPHMSELRISFDAATADTYHKVRVNGIWDNLLENVQWVMDVIHKNNFSVQVTADFVVQKTNYKEIPQFKQLVNRLGIQQINYQRMWNWGTWPKEQFDDMNVYHQDHPEYDAMIELLKQVEWRHIPVDHK
jgi:sulfatase maturation enzyme AslB (radical SAM superfamily)